ncbi:MAG TPA: SAM-dependent methyltransferase, partial [Ornithinibacter sp.]|nr:SAM-dependent methyltransferase [Ornithinibacter sp.]
ARWVRALRPGGRLVLVEGDWSTGAGLTAQRCAEAVSGSCAHVEVRHLPDPALWGREITDERYLVVARP